MSKKYGIANLQLILGFTIGLGNQLFEALEDGKMDWQEALGLSPKLLELPVIIANIKEVPKELGDLDEQESQALRAFVETEFSIPKKNVEAIIEKSFALMLTLYTFIREVRELATTQTKLSEKGKNINWLGGKGPE